MNTEIIVNGIRVYYEMIGEGPPLLFIHGLGSSTKDWEHQLSAFKNYQVIRYDLRGHGKTEKPKEPYSVAMFASDAAQLLKNLDVGPAHIVGHSLGGMIAFQLALDHPDCVKSLSVLNSAPAVLFPSLKEGIKFLLRTASVKLFGMHFVSTSLAKLMFPKSEQAHLREVFIERWRENDPEAYLNALRAFPGWDVMSRLSTLKCPTLIITADHDYTPISYKEHYMKFIEKAELAIIHDSYHASMIDHPEEFNKILEGFISKQN